MSIAVLILASGLSQRFGDRDKLMTELKGQALLAYCLDAARTAKFDYHFMITPTPDPKADLAESFGFEVIGNPTPEAGQGASLSRAITHILSMDIDRVCVLLGDMPFITPDYLAELKALSHHSDIVFSRTQDQEQPPAIFNRRAMSILSTLKSDQGARALDWSNFSITHLELPIELSIDFDTEADFKTV